MTVTEEQQGRAQDRIILIRLWDARDEILLMCLEVVCAVSFPINKNHMQGPFQHT